MAWWRPEEEESPQSRVGRSARVGATSRPVEHGEATTRPAEEAKPIGEPAQPFTSSPPPTYSPPSYRPAHPPLPRRRIPFSLPMAIAALMFVGIFVIPFVAVFSVFDSDEIDGISSPQSHDGPSLVPRDRFAKAMAKVRAEAGNEASLTVLRVAPDRIDAIVTRASGERASIQVLPDLDTRTFGAGGGGQRGLSLRRIDDALPERLLRRASERLGVPRGDLDYMALTSIPSVGGGGTWAIFFEGGGPGRFMTANLDGSNLRAPGQ